MKYRSKVSNQSKTKYYFAYGANMSLSSMNSRCPLAIPIKKFTLKNWRLDFGHHATIVHEPGAICEGALWLITESCEKNLDAFEGYPYYYNKLHLTQDNINFMVYEMNKLDRSHSPNDCYIELLYEGYNDWDLDHQLLSNALKYEYASE